MREALNASSSAACRATSRSRRRCSAIRALPPGDFNTGFIAEEFAHGFDPAAIAHPDRDFLLALAAGVRAAPPGTVGRADRPAARPRARLGAQFVVVEARPTADDARRRSRSTSTAPTTA
jgi:propionyl-CoA carboxylase alpha chain